MLGEFVTSSLVLVLGYAYPALQCFKTVEKNRIEIQELRFWCQYWIIVAALTVLEKIGDVFVSWVPMYGEMKLALFIYLWSPKTKGCDFVYDTMLRPYVSKHETDIERSLLEFREKAWKLAIYYWQNCTELGSTKILQYFSGITQPNSENAECQHSMDASLPSPPSMLSRIFKRNKSDKGRQPIPNSGPSNSYRNQAAMSDSIQVQHQNQNYFIRPEDILIPDLDMDYRLQEKSGEGHHLHGAKIRDRRSKGGN